LVPWGKRIKGMWKSYGSRFSNDDLHLWHLSFVQL
jgi:hypothetical protein